MKIRDPDPAGAGSTRNFILKNSHLQKVKVRHQAISTYFTIVVIFIMSEKRRKLGHNSIYVHTDPPTGLTEHLIQYWNEGISWGIPPEDTTAMNEDDAIRAQVMRDEDSARIRTITDQFFENIAFDKEQKGSASIGINSRKKPNRDPSLRWMCRGCKATMGCFKLMQHVAPCVNSYCLGRCRYKKNRRIYPLIIHLPEHKENCPHHVEPIDPLLQVAKGSKAYRSRKSPSIVTTNDTDDRPLEQDQTQLHPKTTTVAVTPMISTSSSSSSSASTSVPNAMSLHSVYAMQPRLTTSTITDPAPAIAPATATTVRTGPVVQVAQNGKRKFNTTNHKRRVNA